MTKTSLLDIFFPLACPLCGNPLPQIISSKPVYIYIGDETLASSYCWEQFPRELETKASSLLKHQFVICCLGIYMQEHIRVGNYTVGYL